MRGKKGVYMLIKIFHKKENKIMQERVAFFNKRVPNNTVTRREEH